MDLDNSSKILASCQMGRMFEWDKWVKEIPYIKFRPEWDVKIIPPVTGAVVRFRVKYKRAEVSVYLDCYDVLGFFGEPHWELYPDPKGNNVRFKMKDTARLLRAIDKALKAGVRI